MYKKIIILYGNQDLASVIEKYPAEFRKELWDLAYDCSQMTDLLTSFPYAAFAIATGYGDREQHKKAIEIVMKGQSLRKLARVLGVPQWFRKVPPEALKYQLVKFPDDSSFFRFISGTIPEAPDAMANWLRWVPEAVRLGHQRFAIWFARQKLFSANADNEEMLTLLAAFAWYSEHKSTRAGQLIEKSWNYNSDISSVVTDMRIWFANIRTELLMGSQKEQNTWLQPGNVGGYEFVPLFTRRALGSEGEIMSHCVADYISDVVHNNCRIFSVRRNTEHVATLEIRAHEIHDGIPIIEQLYGPDNSEVSVDIWRATFEWFSGQQEYSLPSESQPVVLDRDTWRELMQPYWDAKEISPMFPLDISEHILSEINNFIDRIAYYSGNWD